MFNSKKLFSALVAAAVLSAAPLGGAQANPSYTGGPVYETTSSNYEGTYGNYGSFYGGEGTNPYDTSSYENSYSGISYNTNAAGGYDVYDPTTGTMGTFSNSQIMSQFSSQNNVPTYAMDSFLASATSGGSLNTNYFNAYSSTGSGGSAGSGGSYLNNLGSIGSLNTNYYNAYSNAAGGSGSGSGGSYLGSAASSLWSSYGSSGQSAITNQATGALSSYLGSNSTLGGFLSTDTESDLSFGVAANGSGGALGDSMYPSDSFVSSMGSLTTISGLDSLSGFYDSFAGTDFAQALGLDDVLSEGADSLAEAASGGMDSLMSSLGDSFGDFSLGDFDLGDFDLGSLDFGSFDLGGITDGLGDVLGSFDLGSFDIGGMDFSSITDSISGAIGGQLTDMLGSFLGGFDMGSIVSGIGSLFG
jgi:hypothetical protein